MRLIITYVVPIVLPTAIYMLWLMTMQERDRRAGRPPTPHDVPWVWLMIAGMALALLVVIAVFLFEEKEYIEQAPPVTGEWMDRPSR